ncbi:MAG: nicotinamide mononucleotide transporter [Bacteroidales bacterium]|nr:nicotinamide mononucleotide transporter [Bacteroidales bacterium]
MTLDIFDILYQNLADSSILEAIAVIFGILSVWFAKKENILVYPTGIISVLIYIYICFFVKLYADMGINFVYFVMSIYGWYMWSRKDAGKHVLPISWCKPKDHLISAAMLVGFFITLSYVLSNYIGSNVPIYTDSNIPIYIDRNIPIIDSLTTSFFIVGMWLMARKKIENWIYWIIGNVISIPLYFYKELALTSIQFTVFLVLAIMGFIEWRQKLKQKALSDQT